MFCFSPPRRAAGRGGGEARQKKTSVVSALLRLEAWSPRFPSHGEQGASPSMPRQTVYYSSPCSESASTSRFGGCFQIPPTPANLQRAAQARERVRAIQSPFSLPPFSLRRRVASLFHLASVCIDLIGLIISAVIGKLAYLFKRPSCPRDLPMILCQNEGGLLWQTHKLHEKIFAMESNGEKSGNDPIWLLFGGRPFGSLAIWSL